jgi:hypothetical protein
MNDDRDAHAVFDGLVTTRLCASREKVSDLFAALRPRHRLRQAPAAEAIVSTK